MPTHLDRITFDATVMGGKPCIRGMRVTAGMVVGLVASGHSRVEILALYPYLEEEDITQALHWLSHEVAPSFPRSSVGTPAPALQRRVIDRKKE